VRAGTLRAVFEGKPRVGECSGDSRRVTERCPFRISGGLLAVMIEDIFRTFADKFRDGALKQATAVCL
jgi:hypothetical protein